MVQSISKHKDVVGCLSMDQNYIVTGSKDTTTIVWEFDEKQGEVKEIPKHIFFEHEQEIKSVAISVEYDIVVSGSIDGKMIIHTLNKGKHIQTINIVDKQPISIIKLSKEGCIITFSENSNNLRLFTINGYLLREVVSSQSISCLEVTPDFECLIAGGEKGLLETLRLYDLKYMQNINLEQKICSISFIPKGFIIIGLENGNLEIGYFRRKQG